MKRADKRKERGYTMLEYCAGAAIIGGIVWGALNVLGTSTSGYLNQIANWLDARAGDTWQNGGVQE